METASGSQKGREGVKMDSSVNVFGDCSVRFTIISDLINPENGDGRVGGQSDAPVFDEVRIENACLEHVLHGRTFTLSKEEQLKELESWRNKKSN